MWMMSALEELRGINLAWVIAEHLCKHALGLKENSLICRDQYVTKIAHSLGYLNDKEVAKCSEPIECETWTIKMLENELDQGTHSLIQTKQEAPQPWQARRASQSRQHAIPNEHLLKFHACKDAKSLWEAIKNRLGGNKESKKMQKTILK
ncbi:hypothetical protein Tco_0269727 [Tanacetum coccineum]